jgi:hypothetical protein
MNTRMLLNFIKIKIGQFSDIRLIGNIKNIYKIKFIIIEYKI